MSLARLRRVRRGVRAALALGIVASLAANVLHAEPDFVARVISAWPPLALAITIELISRVPSASRVLSAVRVVGVAVVANVAAWVSYWHMVDVAERYGETTSAAHLLPLSVDGMIVVASVCLVEIGRHIATLEACLPAAAPDRSVAEGIAPVASERSPRIPAQPSGPAVDPAVERLLPAALDVARRIAPNGTPPSGRALTKALRAERHTVPNAAITPLTAAVAARWTEPLS